jgi:hypothetical protein
MAGVTLKYPITGDPTLTVTLPWPAGQQKIDIEPNQKEYRSPAGSLWTVKVGPTLYRIGRVWEALTEAEAASLFAFLEGVDFAVNSVLYCYHDSVTDTDVEVECRILEAPSEAVAHIQMRDVQLVFEQFTHPDADTETT